MSRTRQDLVQYRLQRAHEALDDAQADLDQNRLNSASNRIYYAMFYATTALLATQDLSSSRHSGTIALLHERFAKTGIFPRDMAKQLSLAFEMRNDTDYEDFVVVEPGQLKEMLNHARAFVQKVEELVRAT